MRAQLLRFSIALSAEVLFCASLNWFDDWTLEEMPVKFVAGAMMCGVACLFAIRDFPVLVSARQQRTGFLGGRHSVAFDCIAPRSR